MSDAVRTVIGLLADGARRTPLQMTAAFESILAGETEPALIAAFLMGLRVRGETVDDIVAGARVLRERARIVHAPTGAVDTCGTGGLSWTSLNTSTAAAIVAAAAGAIVAKHGNRSVPPKTGSADVLEALGVNLSASDTQLHACFEQARVAFLFAPAHHSAIKHAAPVRKTLGIRTVFNLLGPLSNPAGARRQVLGVFSPDWVEPYAEALRQLGTQRAWVVHGLDGLDEVSTTGPTHVAEATPDGVRAFTLTPDSFGLPTSRLEDLRGGPPAQNASAILRVLAGERGPFTDLVVANAAAVLHVAGVAPDLQDGVARAQEVLENGRARTTLSTLAGASHG